jgi:hypothetical protein
LNDRDANNDLNDQKTSSHVDSQSGVEEAREIIEDRDCSKPNSLSTSEEIDNFKQSQANSQAKEALDITRQSNELNEVNKDNKTNEANAEMGQQTSLNNKKLTSSPLSMLNTQLDKLKEQILLIDQNRLHDGINQQALKELAEQQKSMATSLDFLEGYADGLVKDAAGRQQFEQSCNDLREQLLQSEHNFNLALGFLVVNQPKQLLIQAQSQSQRIPDLNDRMTTSNKREIAERTRLLEDSSEIQTQEGKQKSHRMDDANRTERIRTAKRDRDNAESTLPLLVQRSV